MLLRKIIIVLLLTISLVYPQQGNRVELGKLQNGTTVSFLQNKDNNWGIKISGGTAPQIMQNKPVQIEIFQSEENIKELSSGYSSVKKTDSIIYATVEIKYGDNVVFQVKDNWKVDDSIISMKRKVEVVGKAPGGFNSSITLKIDPVVSWAEINCMVPSALYGDPIHNGKYSPGGTINYKQRRIIIREDALPAPLFALSFNNGSSVAFLDPSPNGESTFEETKLTKDVITDERFQFGALGVWQQDDSPIEFGYFFPGTVSLYRYKAESAFEPRLIRRYHPIVQGINHSYEVDFRFGNNESFRMLTRNAWRWAWNTLKPTTKPIDVEQMRRILTDHLVNQALTIDGRTNIPFAVATYDTSEPQWNRTMTVMGFVSKQLECADQLLRESDRDVTERGKKMRKIGLSIISSMIQALHKIPLEASGYDLATGKPWTGEHQDWLAHWLRNPSEGMRTLIRAYKRERAEGRLHPEWFNWVKSYVDWLILQQRDDGSFPRRWKGGTSEVAEETGTTSYCPVPLLILMTEETGDKKYREAAIKAAEYIWTNYGSRGLYVGGTNDNPNITDKEAGMLSLEAFLALYESTKENKWLERAKAAGDYAESWIWIWNLPMPVDADNAQLHWKKGVPTIGLQGISARGVGGADEYMDWSTASYAKLYKYTNDEHYLDVARILLNATKSMVAIPGRQYDMRAIGFQQEHWRMGTGGTGRGRGSHRFWLPWISANHLYSITGLEEAAPVIFKELSKGK